MPVSERAMLSSDTAHVTASEADRANGVSSTIAHVTLEKTTKKR